VRQVLAHLGLAVPAAADGVPRGLDLTWFDGQWRYAAAWFVCMLNLISNSMGLTYPID